MGAEQHKCVPCAQRSGQQRFLCSLDTAQPLVQTSTQRRPQSEPRAHMLTRVLAFLRRRVPCDS